MQIPLSSLQVDEGRFQVRNADACSYVQGQTKKAEERDLQGELRRLLKAGVTLDPLIVWRDATGTLWVIDGHHRHEALVSLENSADSTVWVQELSVANVGEARSVAVEVNKRVHFSLHRKELLEIHWRGILCDEIVGSVRDRAKRHSMSTGAVAGMDKQKGPVLEELKRKALSAAVPFDVEFIRSNAPTWKELRKWWKDVEKPRSEDLHRREIEKILQTLSKGLLEVTRTRPEIVVEAFQEFVQDVTGKGVQVNFEIGPDEEF
jgi:hypothetical protein